MELSNLKDIIIEQFCNQRGLIAVLLYGSRAKGTARPDSDVDIAVLYEPECVPSAMQLWDLQQKLAEAVNCEVDLLCLNSADPIISNQIYQFHQALLLNDSKQLANYFVLLSSEYAELKEFVRPMEEQILQRRYHGRS